MQKQYSDRPRVCPSFVGANVSPEIGPFNFAAYNKKKSRCCAAVDGRPNRALRGSSVLATLCHMTRCRCKYAFSRVLLDLSCSLQQESVCCEEILPRNTKKIGTATTYSSPVVPAACYCCCCCCKLCVHHCTQQLQLYLFTTSAVLAVQREQGGWSSLKFDFRMRNHQRPDPTARPLGVEETRHTPSASVHLHGVRVQQVSGFTVVGVFEAFSTPRHDYRRKSQGDTKTYGYFKMGPTESDTIVKSPFLAIL